METIFTEISISLLPHKMDNYVAKKLPQISLLYKKDILIYVYFRNSALFFSIGVIPKGKEEEDLHLNTFRDI